MNSVKKRSDIIETDETRNGDARLNGDPVEDARADEPVEGEQDANGGTVAEIEHLRAEVERNLDNYQRAVADLANYRRRKEQETSRLVEQARRSVLRQFLPVVDDFERAMKTPIPDEANPTWLEGFRLIGRKLWAVLESEGVRPMESVGQPFDPSLHEAVQVDQEVNTHDTVIEEYQRGYFIDDEVLRPATVKVGSADSIPTDAD